MNPRTTAQVDLRGKFKAVSQFIGPLAGWAKKMCKGITKYGTDYSNLMALNPPSYVGVQGTGQQVGTFSVDYTKVKLCTGAIQLPYNIVANVDGNDIVVTWTNNAGLGNAENEDSVAYVLVNAAKNTSVYSLAAGKREDSTISIAVPTSWSSDTLHAFVAFQRGNGADCSASLYLGSFTV